MRHSVWNKKGTALITVIIVFAVLFILGTCFIGVSYADSMLAINQQKNFQAYQVARTGAEIAVKKLKNAIDAENAAGHYYDNLEDLLNANTIKTATTAFSSNFGNTGSYSVSFITNNTDLLDKQMIKILSQGTVGGVNNTTALTLQISSPNLNPNGWINNGWIVNDGYFSMNTGPVVFKTSKNLGHAVMKTGNNSDTVFKAPSLHFVDISKGCSLELTKNTKSFILEANLITFKSKIILQNDGTGLLFLNVYNNGQGLLDSTGTPLKPGYGVIYLPEGLWYGNEQNPHKITDFNDGFYFFKGNSAVPGEELNLDLESDRNNSAKMIWIDPSVPGNQAIIQYLTNLINNETNINVNLGNSVWSKN